MSHESLSEAQKIAAYYNNIDGHYDDLYAGPVCLAEDKVVMSMIAPHLSDSSRVLDIGCGTGLVPSYLNGNPYKGIDVSAEEIKTAVEKLPGRAGDFMVGDMHNLPFPAESFDTVVSTYGPFSYSQEPETLREELLRPLEHGGRFLIMPYTKRTGMGIGLGGSTAAIDGEVPRIYYTEDEVRQVFGTIEGTEVVGVNYLANFVMEKLEGKDSIPAIDNCFLGEQLTYLMNRMGENESNLPEVDDIDLGNLAGLWQQFRKDRQNIDLMAQILTEEVRLFNGVLPAHFARHMVVSGNKS